MNLTFPLARATYVASAPYTRLSLRFALAISQLTCNIIPIFLQFLFYTAPSMMFAVFQNISSVPIDL